MRPFKKVILCLFYSVVVSGCGVLDYDTMVCGMENSRYSYEITYHANDVQSMSVLETVILSDSSENEVTETFTKYEGLSTEHNTIKGVEQTVTLDGLMITIHTKIDYKKYNFMEDELLLFPSDIREDDFNHVQTIRTFFIQHQFVCDEQVSYE